MSMNGTSGGCGAERAVGEQGGASTRRPRRTGPDPELAERPSRRRFTAEYKLRIIQEAGACAHGEVGALLRREGLYTSHLSAWRKQRDEGALDALSRPRGRRAPHPLERENADLRQRIARAEAELARAQKVIEVQGNVSALPGELLGPGSAKRDESTER